MRQSTKITLCVATGIIAIAAAASLQRSKIVHARRVKALLQAAKNMQSLPVLGGWTTEFALTNSDPSQLRGGVIVQTQSGRRTRAFTADIATGVIRFD
jgi:hypothetical protein